MMTKDERQLIRIMNRHINKKPVANYSLGNDSELVANKELNKSVHIMVPRDQYGHIQHYDCLWNDKTPKTPKDAKPAVKGNHNDFLWGIPQDSNIITTTEPITNNILDGDVKIKYNVKDKPTEEIFLNSVDIPSSYLKVKSVKFDSKQAEALIIVKNMEYAIYKKLKALLNDKEVFPIVYKRTYPDSDNVLRISFYGGLTLIGFNDEDGLYLKIKGDLIREEDETRC